MKFNFPIIRLINKEIKDPTFYYDEKIEELDLVVNYSIKLHEIDQYKLEFFVHIALQDNAKTDKKNLFHTDYIAILSTTEKINLKSKVKVPKLELANLIGMVILMIRGSNSTMLQNHPLDGFHLPLLNPLEILEEKFKEEGDFFVLN